MDNLKIANEVFSDLERKNWENVENKLTNDFTFSGAVPQPIDKKQWVNVHRAIQTGIPDLKFNAQQVTANGENKVTAKVKLTGTHSAEIPATLLNIKPISATGKKVSLPEEEVELTFKDGKVSSFYVKPVENGGVQGILNQIQNNQPAHAGM